MYVKNMYEEVLLQFAIAGLQIVRHLTRLSANANFSKFSFVFATLTLLDPLMFVALFLKM